MVTVPTMETVPTMVTVPTMEIVGTMVTVPTMQKQCCIKKQHTKKLPNEVLYV